MVAKHHVFRDVIDHHELAALPDLVADRGADLELAPGRKPEVDLVAHRAGDPAILGDACDGRKTHAGRAAAHFENGRDRVDAGDQRNVSLQ